jgi:hypothetical protein
LNYVFSAIVWIVFTLWWRALWNWRRWHIRRQIVTINILLVIVAVLIVAVRTQKFSIFNIVKLGADRFAAWSATLEALIMVEHFIAQFFIGLTR